MSPTIDPSKLKVTELREELQARGLDTKGNKPVLVKRLKKALEEELNKELPDTSIADTSTEDLDSSQIEKDETKVEEPVSNISDSKETVDSKTVQEPKTETKETVDAEVEKPVHDESSDTNKNTNGEENCTVADTTHIITSDKKEEPNKQSEDVEMNETPVNADNEAPIITENDTATNAKNDPPINTEVEQKGEKRKRTDTSPEPVQKRSAMAVKEDEPEVNSNKVLLSWFDSDLHLQVDRQSLLSAKPIHEGLFGYAWAGVRATHGISKGKARYEVKITEELKWEDFTNQRRERQEKAKERKGRIIEIQKLKDNKPQESEDKPNDESAKVEDKNNDKNAQTEKEEKMDVTEQPQDSARPDNIPDKKTDPPEENQDSKDESESADRKDTDNPEESTKTPAEESKPQGPILTHIFRTGWSLPKTSLQLGETNFSYGYESTGRFVSNKEFKDFAAPYKLGDVIGAYLNVAAESVEMRYTVNGDLQSEVISIPRSELPEDNLVFFPHILARNLCFELNLGDKEEPWFPCPENLKDYNFLQTLEDKIEGPKCPEKKEECEVLMMCGLPGSGKTNWVKEYLTANVDKQITVIGCSHLLDRMTVHGQPLKSTYNGRWSILLDKLQRCLNRLVEIAPQRRRNYILDQTNVFPSAQRRNMRAFEGFKRRAVVVVVGDEEQAKRQSLKEAEDGKDVPDHAILEMKANMELPTKGDFVEEVIFTDLNEEDAKAQVAKYNTEGKSAGYHPGQRRPPFRDERGRWNYNRPDYNRGGGNFRDRGPQRFDRGGRGWGQPPPPGRFPRDRRQTTAPVGGGRDWMRNNRGGPTRVGGERGVRDSRPPVPFNRNRNQSGGGRPGSWQSGGSSYGQGNWGQQGNWGSSNNQGWSGASGYQQNSWNPNQWKYGGGNNQQGGYGQQQQGYGQNWNNYYNQYPQNWSGQSQQGASGSNQYNQYAQWAQYAQQYAQGQNAKYANNPVPAVKK